MYNFKKLKTYMILLMLLGITMMINAQETKTVFSTKIKGNYDLNCVLEGDMARNNQAELRFSGSMVSKAGVVLKITGTGYELIKWDENGKGEILKKRELNILLPWNIRLLKQGSYFRIWINDYTDWIQGPTGQLENRFEPWDSILELKVEKGLSLKDGEIAKLPILDQLEHVNVISPDKKGTSWKDCQIIPGTIFKWKDGKYYMYFVGATHGPYESGAKDRSIGLAVSTDLKIWEVKPEKIILPFDNLTDLYAGGSVVTPDGKIGLMFTATNKEQQWEGFYLATSDSPDGKFKIENRRKPVFKHSSFAHEFDLVELKDHKFKYLLFYAGYNSQMKGDRGYLAYSNDLINWIQPNAAPNFFPETIDNWDAQHVRPRSLTKIDDMWYLWYEGVNSNNGYNSDVVGLARSKDLFHWEYHPRNPILSGMGVSEKQPDNTWTGWPRMILKDSIAYIFYAGSNPERNPVETCMKTISLEELCNWDKTGENIKLVKRDTINKNDLSGHLNQYKPSSTKWLEMKENMNSGWNTWNTNSVMSHVLLPQCFAINLELKNERTGKVLEHPLIGKKGEDQEKIIPGRRTYNGAYTDLTIEWHGISARVQTATVGSDNVIMIIPLSTNSNYGILRVKPSMLWGRSGTIHFQNNNILAELPNLKIPVFTHSKFEFNKRIVANLLEVPLIDTIVISTGKNRSLNEVVQIINEAEYDAVQQNERFGYLKDFHEPMQNVLAWNVIYEPGMEQIITPVSRIWNYSGWGGWVLFDWDTYFAAYMLSLDSKELAYSNAIAITNQITPSGFIPNFSSALGRSDDRSQPPVGSYIVKEIYKKYHEKWFLEDLFDRLVAWNRWWDNNRSVDGYLCWGSNPYPFPPNFPDWLKEGVNNIQGAKWESGLDNSPMYDGILHDSITNLMQLADVGLMSLYIMDCKALAEIAEILDQPKIVDELQLRIKKYTKSLQTLWNDEFGLFLNKNLHTGKLSERLSPTLFYPMLAGAATQHQAERIINEHYFNPNEFHGEYTIPSIARNDVAYSDQNYWRGRIWAPLNFLVYLGIRNYDLPEVQKDLVEKSKALILKSWKEEHAVYENYNGTTGEGGDIVNSDKFYHWGALLSYIAFIEEGFVLAPEKTIKK
jgi:predicted GH43/DUF377 family glycosyl hydrolase